MKLMGEAYETTLHSVLGSGQKWLRYRGDTRIQFRVVRQVVTVMHVSIITWQILTPQLSNR